MNYTADIKKIQRQYLPANFKVTNWAALEPFFKELLERPLDTQAALIQWMAHLSEIEAVVSEDACWRQIKMTCDTENKSLEEAFNFFCMEIQPQLQPYADALNKKLVNHPLAASLDEKQYFTYIRSIKKSIDLFREQNIPIQADLAVMQQQFGVINGKMTVTISGNEYTLQQASKFLEHPDRAVREDAYRKIQERRLQDAPALDQLFTQLLEKRIQLAKNAGFDSYTDYRFKELGRFDYSQQDCFAFHDAVKKHVLPLVKTIYQRKQQQLGVTTLRPWDINAEPAGVQPLRPFSTSEELVEKTIDCFSQLRPFFGDCIQKMQQLKHLDLESRKGKAPGGYNCPLAESGAPFIFMNAAGQMSDVTTMVHEGGHAIHSFLAHPLPLTGFKEYPMEIAEVASMAMELFSMEHWQVFFSNDAELARAKEHQLERVITLFPWIAIIDKFQFWIYNHPQHSTQERTSAWVAIVNEFNEGLVDYSGLETYVSHAWKRQLHLFEVPFYYIEYGIAQLGAIGMWMQFKQDKNRALDNYCKALALGGTQTLPALYNAAGLNFDLSADNIKVLMEFVHGELQQAMA
ncbi:MAG: hypothetical protein RL172_3183 [Bacteroidota bacterium]